MNRFNKAGIAMLLLIGDLSAENFLKAAGDRLIDASGQRAGGIPSTKITCFYHSAT